MEELLSRLGPAPVVTTDTRHCPAGSVFFALRGARFDGNDFAPQALAAGCAYAVVDRPELAGDERLVHVPDVLAALQQLAALHRRAWGRPVLQITGTNGKTTTKELVAAVLARRYRVLSTEGNLNNHIGVPLTLLRLRPEHELAVVETGANHPGEIAALSRIAQPTCGLITNVGLAHIEGFGSLEGVRRTKGELYDYLRAAPGAVVFLHGDDEPLCRMAAGLATVTYGQPGCGHRVEGEVVSAAPALTLRFRTAGGPWHLVATHLVGAYNLPNALAAAAVGLHFGVNEADIAAAIADYVPTNQRSQLLTTERNQLVVDTYNANPSSMRAALDNFRLFTHPRKLVVLGEMRELGAASASAHRDVVEQVRALGCEGWFVGEAFRPWADGFEYFSDVEAVEQRLGRQPVADHLVLIKGSHATRLHELPTYF